MRRVKQALGLGVDDEPTPGVDVPYLAYYASDLGNGVVAAEMCDGRAPIGFSPYTVLVVSFDLAPLPTAVHQIEGVTLAGFQERTSGDPFATVGPLEAEHVVVADYGLSLVSPTVRELGIFSSSVDVGYRELDVTGAMMDDYQERGVRGYLSQYRLLFPPAAVEAPSASVLFTCAEFRLDVTYLMH
jgi:hypothetical protein